MQGVNLINGRTMVPQTEEVPLCGVVLSGDQGQRLRPLGPRLREFPGQCAQFPRRSMLEHTYRRAERLIPRHRVFTSGTQSHLSHPEVGDQLRGRPAGTVVVQPHNSEPGLGLLLSLVHIHYRYPRAAVAVFPEHQFIWGEDRLMRHVRLAHVIVRRHPTKLVMLGIEPDYEEPDYGYLVPRAEWNTTGWGMSDVVDIVEKPGAARARDLMARGALWNTLLMVFSAATMLQWVSQLRPEVYRCLLRLRSAIGTADEAGMVRDAYERLENIDLSKDLLQPIGARFRDSLAVLPVTGVVWSARGGETRIADRLARSGRAVSSNPRRTPLFLVNGAAQARHGGFTRDYRDSTTGR